MPLISRFLSHSVSFSHRKFNQGATSFGGASLWERKPRRIFCIAGCQTVNRLESRGTSTVPTTATPAPAISCFIPWLLAPGLSLPYPSSRFTTPHTPRPAPKAITSVCKVEIAEVKKASQFLHFIYVLLWWVEKSAVLRSQDSAIIQGFVSIPIGIIFIPVIGIIFIIFCFLHVYFHDKIEFIILRG